MGWKTGTWRRSGKPPHGRAAALAMHRQNRIGVLLQFGHICAYCGRECQVTQDHVRPVSRGGADLPENILPACRECNERKGGQGVEEFAFSCPPGAPIHKILRHHRRQWA